MQDLNNEFVPYEESLKLKELGFNEECICFYNEVKFSDKNKLKPLSQKYGLDFQYIKNSDGSLVTAPSFYKSFKWFRENYNLVFNFINYNIVKPAEYHWSITWNDEAKAVGIVKTYEEAELECLKKLIEIAKKEKK